MQVARNGCSSIGMAINFMCLLLLAPEGGVLLRDNDLILGLKLHVLGGI